MSFEVGDRVKVTSSDRDLKGTIVQVIQESWALYPSDFVVEFDDKTLIPPRMTYARWDLELLPIWEEKKCECGLEFVRDNGGRHSSWCPKYKEEQYIDFKGND
jgi:hypothetical protein